MERQVREQVKGYRTQDGAGVNLVRVLGNGTMKEFDPILMLDSFDSTNPADYTAGFPMHPHRGIETISYVVKGKMMHRDSMGNEDSIADGEVQWMTAGSGILHEELLPASERLLGVQLWLNLPAKDKMTAPAYHSIKNSEIKEIPLEHGTLRLLAGTYQTRAAKGEKESSQWSAAKNGSYLPLDYYDIHLEPHASVSIDTDRERSVMIFTLLGEICIGDKKIEEKTAVKLTEGDHVVIKSSEKSAQVLLIGSMALKEPVAWGGPIVMNTETELRKAFEDLKQGNFLQAEMSYEN